MPRRNVNFVVRVCALLCAVTLTTFAPAAAQSTGGSEPARTETSGGGAPQGGKETRARRGFVWDRGPALVLGDETRINFRVLLQAHSRESEAEMGDAESFDLARRRVGVEGRLAGVIDFQVEYEMGGGVPWRDVYANYRRFDSVRVQAGRFKVPFSLDENTGTRVNDFVYRSRAANQLAPGRDEGVMVHGRLWERRLRYEAGLFAHDGDNARTGNPEHARAGRTAAARLTAQPFAASKSPVSDLQVGAAFTIGDVSEGISSLRGRTVMDASFYPSRFWVRGARERVGVEARWRPGPFSVKAEYIRVTTERLGQSVDDAALPPLLASGWYLSGTWLATGERKAAGGDEPERPLLRGGIGAIELAARIEGLRFGAAPPSQEASWSPRAAIVPQNADQAVTVGLNWFPIRGVKFQANLVREAIQDPASGPLPAQQVFWSRVLRFQFSL
jgi:phosphate-selective porin OprO/OprP